MLRDNFEGTPVVSPNCSHQAGTADFLIQNSNHLVYQSCPQGGRLRIEELYIYNLPSLLND